MIRPSKVKRDGTCTIEASIFINGQRQNIFLDRSINPKLWNQIMDETPLKKWATPEEIAEWAYFLTVTNTFCTGQSIIVDGGESINQKFIWKE